jgi:hypothetical protein
MDKIFRWSLLAVFLLFAGNPASAQPPLLTVVSTGSVPGFASAEIPFYLSAQMSDAPVGDLQFEPIAADFVTPVDRVEWSFRFDPQANETRAVSLNKRRYVARHLVTVEVRLYLGDEFQSVTFAQADIHGGPQDEEFANFVRTLSQRLFGAQGASYRAIQRRATATQSQ